ncbi:MAG TPA: 4Fe-4S binding protein [Firmicutes bacterium]|nr:4Fe-4S binding protein [Bacillota bacterium]
MRIATMIGDISRSLFRKPVTRQYPFEKSATPKALRGRVEWDAAKCTGCNLCVRDCPAMALDLHILDRKNKQFVMRYHLDRCVFCAQCEESCRFDAIHLSDKKWELAALTQDPFDIFYGEENNVRTVVEKVLKGNAGQDAGKDSGAKAQAK